MLASEGARLDDDGSVAPSPTGPTRATDHLRALCKHFTGPLSRERKRVYVGIVLALISLAIGWHISPLGLGVAGDSVTYLGVSNNIVDGKGITSPFVNEWDELPPERALAVAGHSPSVLWPPGYPVAIAAGAHLDLTTQESARWLAVLSFMIVVVATGWLAARLAHGSPGAMLAAGLFIAFSPRVHQLVVLVYSDLFAAALSTLAVIALVRAMEGRPAWLAGFWMLAAMTSLTRIAGGALIVVAVVLVALWYPADLRRRAIAALAIATSLVPLLAWRLHVASVLGGTPSNFSYHPRWDTVHDTPGLLMEYLAPSQLEDTPRSIAIIAMVVLVVIVVLRVGLRRLDRHPRLPIVDVMAMRVIVAVAAGYIAATIFAAFFFGALLSVDVRTYLSVAPLVVALAVGLVTGLVARPGPSREPVADPRPRFAGAIPVLALGIVVIAQVVTGWNFLVTHPFQPSTHVLGTPDDAALGQILPRYDLLFSNSPSRLYTETGLTSITPPTLIRPSTLESNPDHDHQLEDMGTMLREHHGAFVYYLTQEYFGDDTFLSGSDIAQRLDLEEVGESATRDSIVYAPRTAPGGRR
jgi:hypothetical protein